MASPGFDLRVIFLFAEQAQDPIDVQNRLDNVSAGLSNAVFIAYLSSLTNRAYTATQYALFSSLFTLPGKFLGGFSGIVVDAAGYVTFFIYAGALGIPAILLVIYVLYHRRPTHDDASDGPDST